MKKNEVNGTVNSEELDEQQEKKPGLIKTAWNKTPKWVKWIAAGTVICIAGGFVRNAIEDHIDPEDAADGIADAMKDAGMEVVEF